MPTYNCYVAELTELAATVAEKPDLELLTMKI
jgi:hypothetical protein